MDSTSELTTASAPSILLDDMAPKKNPAAVSLGATGGKKTAEKGSAYFRKLQARRKHRRGGRPPKPK